MNGREYRFDPASQVLTGALPRGGKARKSGKYPGSPRIFVVPGVEKALQSGRFAAKEHDPDLQP
jgi:hypothetical protein